MYSTRYSCQIVLNLNFLDRFSENTKISNFTNILQMGAELLHAGGRTGIQDEANGRFWQFFRTHIKRLNYIRKWRMSR